MSRPWIGPGELLGDLARAVVSAGGGLLQRGPGLGQGRVQRQQVGLVLLDRGELGLDRLAAGGQLVGRAVEPRGQPAVNGQPRLDLFQPGRVVVPALSEVAQAEGDLAGLVGQPFEVGGGLGELGDGPGQRLERPRDPLQEPLRRAVGLVEQGVTLGRGRPELLGVGSRCASRASSSYSPRLGIGGGQLVALELQQGPLARRARPSRSAPAACAAMPRGSPRAAR